jgi:hypothetical protein
MPELKKNRMKKIAILLALISFSIDKKSQQVFPATPVLSYDDFSKI